MRELTRWDVNSGIRERLALLAQFGPDFEPSLWGYHPSSDYWYYCGPREDIAPPRTGVHVRQEGVRSLELIAERWNIERRAAMALIGHPEAAR